MTRWRFFYIGYNITILKTCTNVVRRQISQKIAVCKDSAVSYNDINQVLPLTTRDKYGPRTVSVVWNLRCVTTGPTHAKLVSLTSPCCSRDHAQQAEAWWRASIWRSHRKVVIKQCSYHNNIIDIQNRLPYSKVVYPAIIVLFSWLMEVNHGVRTGPDYPFR